MLELNTEITPLVPELVSSLRAVLPRHDNLLDELLSLRQHREGRQQPAVTQNTLQGKHRSVIRIFATKKETVYEGYSKNIY